MGNVTSSVAARFAFFPPDPPTYEVYKDGEDDDGRLVFTGLTADKNVRVHLLETKGGNKIVATFWKHPFGRFTILYSHGNAADLGQMQELFIELRAHLRVNIMSVVRKGLMELKWLYEVGYRLSGKLVPFDILLIPSASILESLLYLFLNIASCFVSDCSTRSSKHAQVSVLWVKWVIYPLPKAFVSFLPFWFGLVLSFGCMLKTYNCLMFLSLVKYTGVMSLCSYDYSGYGASSGKPSELNTYYDIEAVYNCLKNEHGVKEEDVILYGQSVGSGPTLHLASRLQMLRGVVLHSAILSGIRVLYNVKMTFWFDIFKNVDKIRNVDCPVLVIHGTEDDIVDWSHGKRLWELAKEKYDPLWVKGGGHCNLETYPEYIKHLRKFVNAMEKLSFTKENKSRLGPTDSMSESKHNKCLRFGRR
ncbi:hypothetical protein RHSIM_Rhsim01G0046500 [Rhododendron simsii]|uniref:Serine aminopeptidase S33 domain-containing protein n=1 Tax=Rhododendron simsii TaxID=118357 RepID=A0A834LYT0_RHOSS|nr:hypothetical protein RHSIM_Rhsim01G0046500 [Rhododendron simsii]